MPNRNYINGRAKEYRILKQLENRDCDIVLRSAGSKSVIDCIGINTNHKTIYLIQSKPKSMSQKKKQELYDKYNKLNGMFHVIWSVE